MIYRFIIVINVYIQIKVGHIYKYIFYFYGNNHHSNPNYVQSNNSFNFMFHATMLFYLMLFGYMSYYKVISYKVI